MDKKTKALQSIKNITVKKLEPDYIQKYESKKKELREKTGTTLGKFLKNIFEN